MTKNTFDYDLIVIGAGSGGVRAARKAAELGVSVAVVEERALGGTCVNVGCVPKKLYVYASEFGAAWQDAKGFGWNAEHITFDWATLRDNKKKEIARLNAIYEKLLLSPGVDIIKGHGLLTGPNSVSVAERSYRAKKILLATGTWPFVPPIPGSDLGITSNEIFDLENFPDRLLVVGGGYIATEFAGVFAGLGSNVIQSYRGELFLRGFDDEIREFLAEQMRAGGIDLRFNHQIKSIERNQSGTLSVHTSDQTVEVDSILFATGRRANLADLNLETTKVKIDSKGAVIVSEDFQTNEPSIFALGDLTGGLELTPVAIAEAMAFVRSQFAQDPQVVDYEYIPTAVFSQPAIGTIGLTENEARAAGHKIEVYRSNFKPMKNTLSGKDERTLMKLVVNRDTDQVLGLHMVGPDAGEICQGMAIAMRLGATKKDFDQTIGIHPTSAEEFVTM